MGVCFSPLSGRALQTEPRAQAWPCRAEGVSATSPGPAGAWGWGAQGVPSSPSAHYLGRLHQPQITAQSRDRLWEQCRGAGSQQGVGVGGKLSQASGGVWGAWEGGPGARLMARWQGLWGWV